MIRPIVRPIIKSITRSILGAVSPAWQLNFDGTIYATLSDSFSPSGANTVEIKYKSTTTSTLMALNNLVKIEIDGTISIPAGNSITVNGASNNTAILDGSEVTVLVTGVGGEVYTDIGTDDTNKFIGQILSQKFTSSVTPANSQTHIFGSGRTDYQFAEEGDAGLGSELIVDGGLDNPSDWNPHIEWTIANSYAEITDPTAARNLSELNGVLVEGATYLNTVELLSLCSRELRIVTGVGVFAECSQTLGYQSVLSVCGAAISAGTQLKPAGSGTGTLRIDNVSVKRLNKAAILYNVEGSDWT